MASILLARGLSSQLFPSAGFPGSDQENDAASDGLIFVDPSSYEASVFDRAVMRGDGFFEAVSVIDGTIPVSLNLHMQRLAVSAAALDMPAPDIEAFTTACQRMISCYSGGHNDPMLRILVSRGLDDGTGIGRELGSGIPSVWMYMDGVGARHTTDPLTMVTLTSGHDSHVAADAPWLMLGAKTLSYVVNMAAEREANRRGFQDALFITTDNFVMESPHASVVARFGNQLVTPDPKIGILHGTSQQEFFAYGRRHGMVTEYCDMSIERFKQADQLFQTRGGWVIPISNLDSHEYEVDTEFVASVNNEIHYDRAAQIAELKNDTYQ